MLKTPLSSRVSFILIALLMLVLPNSSWSMNLPLSRDLTVRLSTLDSLGQLQTVSEITSKTDSLGKIAFNFPTVPSATDTPFLHIQIMDGVTVLRQTIVPSPQAGGNVDVGVSEVTDLQARSLLKASAVSGRLTPLHLLLAQALLRTPTISIANAESAGAAIAAGADSIVSVLVSDGLISEQLTTFMSSLSQGLIDSAAIYRKSVDDALAFDQKVEAYRRGEAFAVLLQSLIKAGSDAGINLETICTAFASAGAAAEAVIEPSTIIDPITKSSIRLCYLTGVLNLSNYRFIKEIVNSLNYVGISRLQFTYVFDTLDLMQSNTKNNQKYYDSGIFASAILGDVNAIGSQEFNSLALQDLMLFKVTLQIAYSNSSNTEYSNLMLDITSRMASMGGVMSGMTPAMLIGILGSDIIYPSNTAIKPLELAVWSYISQQPTFTYTPITGLLDQVITKPTVPAFDKLAEPYKSLALLEYDINLISIIRKQEQTTVENTYLANPVNPQRWIPFSSVYQILDNDRQRSSLVRQHISGVSPEVKSAMIYLLTPHIPTF